MTITAKVVGVQRQDGQPDTCGNPPPLPWKDWPQGKRDKAGDLLNDSNWQNLIDSMPVAKIFRPGDVANVATIVIPG